MDLRIFARVARRFKVLVCLGVLAASSLSVLSYAKVDLGHGKPVFHYRSQEQWTSDTRVLLTQHGSEWGGGLGVNQGGADLPGLATVYSSLVTSDAVKRIILERGPLQGKVAAATVSGGPNHDVVLPIVDISAVAYTAPRAVALANRAAEALTTYIDAIQTTNHVSRASRIQLRILNTAVPATILVGRSKTLPVAVLLGVLLATFGLAVALENMRPTRVMLEVESPVVPEPARAAS